ncbi:hypothetical protein FGG08_005902 [Glutinoglossum americanum]|uniref:mRNA export factor GLE1 n=1 Tax=Glutinoglossum americanum TaxID=1670608 RepID=A0A9P8I4K0_9PEZI|nr:hypothetical protein FGG08_005902 [Glutinoglossum americanum]
MYILHIQYLLSEQEPKNAFSCEREVLHPLDPKAEPGAFLFYDSDDSIEEKNQRPSKRTGTTTSMREEMADSNTQRLRKPRPSPSTKGLKTPSGPGTPPTSAPPSPPVSKRYMPSSSAINSPPHGSRGEHSSSIMGRSGPSQKLQAVSPPASEYRLFPAAYQSSPPVLRHHRRGVEDFDAPELGEVSRDTITSSSVVKGKTLDILYSSVSEDENLQDFRHGSPGWTATSPSRASGTGFEAIFDNPRTAQDNSSPSYSERGGLDSALASPAIFRSGDLSRDGITARAAHVDEGSQFSLPSPPYPNKNPATRMQPDRQSLVYGGSLVKDDTLVSPERESHDRIHHRTTSSTRLGTGSTKRFTGRPDNLPHSLDTLSGDKLSDHHLKRASIDTRPQQSMVGSVASAVYKDKAPDCSNSSDPGNAPEIHTNPQSKLHLHSLGIRARADIETTSATTSSGNFRQGFDSLIPEGSLTSVNLNITDGSVPISTINSRGTLTPGTLKTKPSFANDTRPYTRSSIDSRASEHTSKRSDSGSRSLHSPARLVGKVRSLFKSGGNGSTRSNQGASRKSISFDSSPEPDEARQNAFEEHLILQTLENRYQQHALDRRQELVEALQYLTSPSAVLEGETLLNEFRRLRLETDSLFLLELEKGALEKKREHELQLNTAAARHERVRRDAELVRNEFEAALRMEIERRREEEKRELDRIRQAKADQELAERRRQVELERKQAAEERRWARLEQQRLEEETRIKAAEDTRKIAEEKARAKAEAEHQARIKAEEDKKAADLLTVSAAARGTSFTAIERDNNDVSHMQEEYLRLHALLKGFRSWLVKEAKGIQALKAKMGEMRREIKKTVGQLTAGKNANKEPLLRIANVLNQALNDADGPKIDVRQFFVLPNEREMDPSVMSQPPDRPALFVYLLNIFAKAVIAQFIDEAGVNPKAAEPVGVVAVTIFANDNFKWRGTPLIDILIAKYRRVCPVLFGLYGKDTTRDGRQRLGWHATNGEEWVSEQTHAERMTGLGAGYAAVTLRNFSKSKMANPYSNVKYWQSLQWICDVPPLEATDTHFIVLKAMIENYAAKFIDLYGDAAKLALRKALITFPKESKRSSPAIQAAAALADALKRDEMIYLTNSERDAEAKAIMAGVLFR